LRQLQVPALASTESLEGAVPPCGRHLNQVSPPDQLIQIHGRCRQCLLRIEIPFVPVLTPQKIADRLGALVGIVLRAILHQLIAMDLAEHQLVCVFTALALPG